MSEGSQVSKVTLFVKFKIGTHVRVAVDASGYAGKGNRSQIVLFHHFQAVQIGVFQHLF